MTRARQILLLLVTAVLLVGVAVPAQADAAAKRKPAACAAAKAKAKKKPTAARKRAVKRACRKPATKRPAAPTAAAAPTAPAASPASSAPAPATSALQDGVVACANRERAARGLAVLSVDASLTRAAAAHAADMAVRGFFAHRTPEGLTPWDRISAALQGAEPFNTMGENIAMGFRSAEAACEGWMNSDGHRRNILNPGFTLIGAGWVDGYSVQNFGAR